MNTPILLTDRITRTRYKRVGSHWSETSWASWGLAGLILASLVVFGVLGCQKPYPPTPIIAPYPLLPERSVANAGTGAGWDASPLGMICDDAAPVEHCHGYVANAGTHHAN